MKKLLRTIFGSAALLAACAVPVLTACSDSDEGKVTAVTLLGVDGANNKAKEYFEDALDAVAPLGERSKPLFELADLLGARTF